MANNKEDADIKKLEAQVASYNEVYAQTQLPCTGQSGCSHCSAVHTFNTRFDAAVITTQEIKQQDFRRGKRG